MKKINLEEIKNFYDRLDEVWSDLDLWYMHTYKEIKTFLYKHLWNEDAYVLNAGSAGNTYGLPYCFHHVDISDNHMENIDQFTIANIEALPFSDNIFEHCICVGSVLNYCDAVAAISELSRVLKPNGQLIIEFENSWGYEYYGKSFYGKSAELTTVAYRKESHNQWLYSKKHIISILNVHGLKIIDIKGYHILSAAYLKKHGDESIAAKYVSFDVFANKIPFIKEHANNIIICAKKEVIT